jgi:hypothetical protein
MHAIKLMLINYLTKFCNSKLCVKVVYTSYDILKIKITQENFVSKNENSRRERSGRWRAPSDRSLVSGAPFTHGRSHGVDPNLVPFPKQVIKSNRLIFPGQCTETYRRRFTHKPSVHPPPPPRARSLSLSLPLAPSGCTEWSIPDVDSLLRW